MPFALKKFISQFLMPLPLVCECFLLGWVLTRFTKYKKTGRFLTLLSLFLFLLFGYGFGRTYLYNLERRYPPFNPLPVECEVLRGTPVVVLGQGMPEKSDLPVRYQNNPVFERRLFEGVRVAKLIPESRLIVSMAGEATNSVKQAALNDYMSQLNFPTNRVFMFTTARDTSDEARLAKQMIEKCANAAIRECANGTSNQDSTHSLTNSRTNVLLPSSALRPPTSVSPANALMNYSTNERTNFRTLELSNFRTDVLILATSASHLPRSMKIFQKQGFKPFAAPCDYTDCEKPRMEWKTWYQWPLPSGGNLEKSERALYEWLGNLFERSF